MITTPIQQLLKKRLGSEVSYNIIKLSSELKDAPPSLFMDLGYKRFSTGVARHNGRIFEGLFLAVLGREGISHVMLDAEFSCLPYSTIDVAIYSAARGPFLISLKSSLRERWKQSDLEFSRIKTINPKAVCGIATLEDAGMPLRLLDSGKLLGCDHVIDCRVPTHWNLFLKELRHTADITYTSDTTLGLHNYSMCS